MRSNVISPAIVLFRIVFKPTIRSALLWGAVLATVVLASETRNLLRLDVPRLVVSPTLSTPVV
jgi:hypothetical protein